MKQYHDLLRRIQSEGTKHEDRTGTGTTRIFGHQMRFDLSVGFPLLTTKKMWWKGIVEELLWMLSGSIDNKDLQERGVHIWDEWATREQCAKFGRVEGDLGPVYGHQWRNFGATPERKAYPFSGPPPLTTWLSNGVDQIANVLDLIVNNPNSRRIILSGWNPKEATEVALPPCHTLTQFVVRDGKLSSQMYQRSADVFLGVPFNIASYALLTHMLAHVAGLEVGEYIHVFGDVHIYRNHRWQVTEQLARAIRPIPHLDISCHFAEEQPLIDRLLCIGRNQIILSGYDPHPAIKAEVSV